MAIFRVAVLAFDQISPFHLSVPCMVLGEAAQLGDGVEVLVCAQEARSLKTSAGFDIGVSHGLEAMAKADMVVVPSWQDIEHAPPRALLDALLAAYARGATVVGLCLGAYVLAEAGLLDGRRATTHWAYVRDFSARFPLVEVDADVLYIDEGNIVTSAGTTASVDCCLHLLRRQYGSEAANRVARMLVMAPHRQGGQAQFIEQPVPVTARDSRLAELLDWVRANLDLPHNLDSLAEKAKMSRRTFTRHFRQLTGATVGEWLLSERLALSQRLLETTHHPIERIAGMAGFGSSVSLRQHFAKAFRTSPREWRRTFQGGDCLEAGTTG